MNLASLGGVTSGTFKQIIKKKRSVDRYLQRRCHTSEISLS